MSRLLLNREKAAALGCREIGDRDQDQVLQCHTVKFLINQKGQCRLISCLLLNSQYFQVQTIPTPLIGYSDPDSRNLTTSLHNYCAPSKLITTFSPHPNQFQFLQSSRYLNPSEYFPVYTFDGPKLCFGYCIYHSPEGEYVHQIRYMKEMISTSYEVSLY